MFQSPLFQKITAFLRKDELRIWLVIAAVIATGAALIYKLFSLQIVHGDEYLSSFRLRIRRDISIEGTRGLIYDRNGNVLAYNDLAYSVIVRNLGEDSTSNDLKLNRTILEAIEIIEENHDRIDSDFGVQLLPSGNYGFTQEGRSKNRFLADIYGHPSIDDLTEEERESTAEDVIRVLALRYHIGTFSEPGNYASEFLPGEGYEKDRLLQLVCVRYHLSLNSFQRYLATTIASDVSESTVAAILENTNHLEGIDIEDTTVRRYNDAEYFAQILGYTGRIDTEELAALSLQDPDYSANDIVGKSGIEKAMELDLQGKKGKKTVYVDSLGNELETINLVLPEAGNDVYLTIDADLQKAAYDILEKKLADIILNKIRPEKEYIQEENASSASIIIPIYDVYYSVIKNSVIDITQFDRRDAGSAEKAVHAAFANYSEDVYRKVEKQLLTDRDPYNELTREFKNYETYIVQMLYNNGVLDRSRIDTEDETYNAWTTEETISMAEFLSYAISRNWVNVADIEMNTKYANSEEAFKALTGYIDRQLRSDLSFSRMIYRYMLLSDTITGEQICNILIEQGCVEVPVAEKAAFDAGEEDAYTFMVNRIANHDLTPAQLNLDPYSGSMVITDPWAGQVLALVSYPSFDNNRMSNGVDAVYYEKLRNDLSKPLINYATQQRTAPGSTFKMVSSAAGLMEGVIETDTEIECTGWYTRLGEPYPRCWVYPGHHGLLNVTGGIANSCNDFFYDVGYRLSQDENEKYDSSLGIEKLARYAEMFGLGETSGIEIEEASPLISSEDAIRSAIGQGNSNYTTVGLARYVSTVANGGVCYNLTLLDHVNATDGTLLQTKEADIRNVIDMRQEYWDAIHEGMREVVQGKIYFRDLPVEVAGKTGTAQESTQRPNHALFVCYAPYDQPQIAVATRIANGYTSDYAAQITKEVLEYYFDVSDREEILSKDSEIVTTGEGD